jgi:hypothetical protein
VKGLGPEAEKGERDKGRKFDDSVHVNTFIFSHLLNRSVGKGVCCVRLIGDWRCVSESVYLGRGGSLFETKGIVFTKQEAEKQHFSKILIENLDVGFDASARSSELPLL